MQCPGRVDWPRVFVFDSCLLSGSIFIAARDRFMTPTPKEDVGLSLNFQKDNFFWTFLWTRSLMKRYSTWMPQEDHFIPHPFIPLQHLNSAWNSSNSRYEMSILKQNNQRFICCLFKEELLSDQRAVNQRDKINQEINFLQAQNTPNVRKLFYIPW